jgi:hypothetical protein
MSAVTVFFILQDALTRHGAGPFLMLAIGPGVTAVLLDGEIGCIPQAPPSRARVDAIPASSLTAA